MSQFDAIVIGSGNAGLTAAVTLQRGGAKTLLLERHNIPGGCATSFVRGDFEFEVALHQLSGMGTEEAPFIMRHIFDQLGIMDKIQVVEEEELYRIVQADEVDVTLPANWQELENTLIHEFPEEASSIKSFLKMTEALAIESFLAVPAAQQSNNSEELRNNCPNYIQNGLKPAKQVLDEYFDSDSLKAVLGAYWGYLGVALKDMPYVDLAMMIYSYAAYKPAHVKGGSQAISSALLESFQEAGGEARFNCGATKILTEGDRITGVETEDGQQIPCATVISNTSPIHTYYELLNMEAPQQARHDMKSRTVGTSAFVLYAGLDCPPETVGIETASTFIVEHHNEELAVEQMKTLAAPSFIMVTCYNQVDDSFAPKNKTALSILCLQYGEPWDSVAPQDYHQTKYEFAQHLLDQAEKVYPNIRHHLEEIEVGTPLTMMRYLNTPGGAIYGFDQNTHDSNLFRERMDAIDGLYLASAWNGMGGFQPTYMAGPSTARASLKYLATVEAEQHQEVEHA